MAVVIASVAFWAAVVYQIPGDMGTVERVEMRGRYRRLKTSEAKAAREKLESKQMLDAEFLDLVLVDWDVKTKTGEVVPYTPATRVELFEDWAGTESAFVNGYFNAFSVDAGAKNSEPLSATS